MKEGVEDEKKRRQEGSFILNITAMFSVFPLPTITARERLWGGGRERGVGRGKKERETEKQRQIITCLKTLFNPFSLSVTGCEEVKKVREQGGTGGGKCRACTTAVACA